MTTVNLSAGLKTQSALQSLRDMKAQMQSEMKGLRLSIDTSEFKAALKGVAAQKFDVSLSKGKLEKDLGDALTKGFGVLREVNIDTGALTRRVHAAVQAGMTGVSMPTPQVTGTAAITPTLDMRSLRVDIGAAVADATAAAMERSGQRIRSKGDPSASLKASTKLDGATLSYSEPVADPNEALRVIQAGIRTKEAEAELKRQDIAAQKGNAEVAQNRKLLVDRESDFQKARAQANAQAAIQKKSEMEAMWGSVETARKREDELSRMAMRGEQDRAVQAEKSRAAQTQREIKAHERRLALQAELRADQVKEEQRQLRSSGQGNTEIAQNRAALRQRDEAFTKARAQADAQAALQKKSEMESMWSSVESARKKEDELSKLAALAGQKRADESAKNLRAQTAREIRAYEESLDRQTKAATEAQRITAQNNREAQRSANQTLTARRAARATDDRAVIQSVRFENPGASTELAQLNSQLKKLKEARAYIDLGKEDLAVKTLGATATAQVGRISELEARIRALSAANKEGTASADAHSRALRRQMQETYNAARTNATGFTSKGAQVVGAKALIDTHGEANARAFLNNSALIDQVAHLDTHRKAVGRSAAEMHRWNMVAKDGHSAMRGLAGSLGLLWTTWGNTVPIVAAAAIGLAMRSVFTVGKDLEYQLTFVSALTNNSVVDMEKFASVVRGSMVMPKEAAEAMRGLAQNGLTVRESLQALPSVLNLATAGEMSLSAAALGATGVMAAFNLQVNDLGRVGDVFAKAAAVSNTSVTSMVESMKQASTVSDSYNVSLEETAASLAILAKRNIVGTAAGTALRNMLTELATPTEKAGRAFKEMGVSVFDDNKRLKGYGDMLTTLQEKTSLLNEKGRLTFLNDVFGERGAKAANALLSDLDLYRETLREIKEESKDFAAGVTKALQATTEGKIKAMLVEFQLTAAETFNGASKEINHFIDALRGIAASDTLKSYMETSVKGITSFTSFLVEHGDTIKTTLLAWAGAKAAFIAIEGFLALRTAMAVAQAAAVGTTGALTTLAGAAGVARVALLGVLGAATGGVALIVALAAEYFLLTRNTSEASKAQEQFADRLSIMGASLDREINQLQESNARLLRRNELMRDGLTLNGMTGRQADKAIEKEQNKQKLESHASDVAAAQAAFDKHKAVRNDYDNWKKQNPETRGPRPVTLEQLREADQSIPQLLANLNKNKEIERQFRNKVWETERQEERNDNDKRLNDARDFNEKLRNIQKASKGKTKVDDLRINDYEILYGTPEQAQSLLEARRNELNKRGQDYTTPAPASRSGSGSAAAKERQDALAGLKWRQGLYAEEMKMEDAHYEASMTILKAREKAKAITVEGFAIRQEQAASEHLTRLRVIAEKERTDIEKMLKASLNVSPQDLLKEINEGAAKDINPEKIVKGKLAKDAKLEIADILATLAKLKEIDARIVELSTKLKGAAEASTERVQGELLKTRETAAERIMQAAQRDVATLLKLAQAADALKVDAFPLPVKLPFFGIDEVKRPGVDSQSLIDSVNKSGDGAASREARTMVEEARRRQEFQQKALGQNSPEKTLERGSGSAQASIKAMMEAYDQASPEINKVAREEEALNRTLQRQVDILADLKAAQGGTIIDSAEVNAVRQEITGLQEAIRLKKENITTLQQMRDAVSEQVGQNAKETYEYQRSAAYGMTEFWSKYREEAYDSAKLVGNVMNQSFSTMEAGLMKFVTTGKGSFKSLVGSVIADAARMMAAQGVRQLLSMGLNAIIGAFSPTTSLPGNTATTPFGSFSLKSANGNVATPYGPANLRTYRAGGVANHPMISVFGEGRKPEAYVPLEDGRTIPVTVSGNAGNQGGISVNVNVNIASDGNTQVESDTSSKTGADLGNMIQGVVVQTIVRERRPGGLLYANA